MEPNIIPIRTHIITHEDDIVEVTHRYTRNVGEPGDVICIAESVVAIAQGRYYPPEKIKPRKLAKRLAQYTARSGSLTNPASMELAIREVGASRVLAGAIVGGVTKRLGRKGDFFRVAGGPVARIDDVARTMHPFDRYIVLGPKDPDQVARDIYHKTGISTAVADVNDLAYVDIIGTSPDLDPKPLYDLLTSNPFGNDDQKTPILIIKGYKNLIF